MKRKTPVLFSTKKKKKKRKEKKRKGKEEREKKKEKRKNLQPFLFCFYMKDIFLFLWPPM